MYNFPFDFHPKVFIYCIYSPECLGCVLFDINLFLYRSISSLLYKKILIGEEKDYVKLYSSMHAIEV